jgi:hypothetical protein
MDGGMQRGLHLTILNNQFISPQRGSFDLLELTPSGCCSRTECGPPLREFPCRSIAVDQAECPPCPEDTDDVNRMSEVMMMIMVRVGIVDMIRILCRVWVSS